MQYNWTYLSHEKVKDKSRLREIIFANRQIADWREFDQPKSPEGIELEDLGIEKEQIDGAIEMITGKKTAGEKVVIWGDYDVDGVCATCILWETIGKGDNRCTPYIPDREKDGYGLTKDGVERLVKDGVKLIITVDNGIVAKEAIKYARSKGCDVIVIDHHERGDEVPDASWIIHSEKSSASALAWLFSKRMDKIESREKLGLAALGVICDLIPLKGVNRSMARYGIEELRKSERIGIKAICEDAKIEQEKIGVYEIGFVIGPRINATGRLTNAMDSLRLMCTRDSKKASYLAKELGRVNTERQEMTQSATRLAMDEIEKNELPKLVALGLDVHPGIVGLVASRITERYGRPAVVLSTQSSEITKGSARSVAGFDITAFLRQFSDILIGVGGHKMAAGLSLKNENFEVLLQRMREEARKIDEGILGRKLKIDCVIEKEMLELDTAKEMEMMGPFGMGNSEPVFVLEGAKINAVAKMGREGKHYKLMLDGGISAIWFGAEENEIEWEGQNVDIAFKIGINRWNGIEKLQLIVKDVKKKQWDKMIN